MKLDESANFLKALEKYRDARFHLLGDGPNPVDPSGNTILYECHALLIYNDLKHAFNNIGMYWIECYPEYREMLKELTVASGLYRRKPRSDEDQAHDDYTGLAFSLGSVAVTIYKRGLETGFYYDWKQPNKTLKQTLINIIKRKEPVTNLKFWHARLPGQAQHYGIGCGKSPSLFGWLLWLGSILFTIRKPNEESGWLLDYLKLRTALIWFPSHWAVKIAKWAFVKQLNKHYFGSISRVYGVYFGPNHPFARYSSWPSPPAT